LLEVGTGFNAELSGRENTYLSGAILGMKKAELDRKFDEIVAFAELGDFIDTPVKRYSSGMYTRLAFAVAAHLNPEILLVDEVLAVGDAAFQRKCLGKMDEVSKQGRTVLFVTHNMAMIENLCTRVLFFSQGRLVQDGPTNQVISHYLNEVSSLSDIPLDQRTDRIGEGEIRIAGIEFLDRLGKITTCSASGQELVIRLRYVSNTNKVFRNCRVSVSVHKDERAYFLLSTELVDDRQLDISGSGYIDFVIPELPLSAGEYYVNPFIESNRIKQDWVTRAAMFSVTDGDFYGTGRNYPFGWRGQCVLVRYKWSLNNHALQ
jgi:lipopolysaccharide transport system ATP-binding protein